MDPTPRTLLSKPKADGPRLEIAWGVFQLRYQPVIAAFARRLGAAPGDVDDVVQDVLLSFFAIQPRFTYDLAKGRLRSYPKTRVLNRLAAIAAAGTRLQIDRRPVEELDPADRSVERAWAADWEREQLHRAFQQVRA